MGASSRGENLSDRGQGRVLTQNSLSHSPFPIPHSLLPIPHSLLPIPHPPSPSQRKCKFTLRNETVLCYDEKHEKILTLLAWERAAWISSIEKDDKIKWRDQLDEKLVFCFGVRLSYAE